MNPEYKEFKIFQAVKDNNGDPDFHFCIVRCTQKQFNQRKHLKVINQAAKDMGCQPYPLYYDCFCPAGRAMMHLFEWDTASVLTVPVS